MEQKNKLICHFLGGCGISLSQKVFEPLATLGDGFADIVFNYMDTSDANITKIEPKGEFWRVKTSQLGKTEITGSGGERITHLNDAMVNVKEYLDTRKYNKMNPNEFHLVVASGSGGTGSLLSNLIINELLRCNVPVIGLLVGDSTNGLYTINTLNTLASLNNIAVRVKKPLNIIYANNAEGAQGGNLLKGEDVVNKIMHGYIASLLLFLSSNNEYLDNQDMRGIIDQSNYKTLPINPGLYGLQFFSKEIKAIEGSVATVGRTLLASGTEDFSLGEAKFLHHKTGYVVDQDALAKFDSQFPLHMASFNNFFLLEQSRLNKIADESNKIASSIVSQEVKGASNSTVDEDTGLIF